MLISLFAPLYAATWTIDPSGHGQFHTLAEAMPQVQDGDILQLSPGVYPDTHFSGHTLKIVALQPERTQMRGWVVESGQITIQGGIFEGGDVALAVAGAVELDQVIVQNSPGEVKTALEVASGGHLYLHNSRISNYATRIAPISVQLGGALEVEDSVLRGNKGQQAGAIWNDGGTVRLDGVLVQQNQSPSGAGAVGSRGGSLQVISSGFDGNQGSKGGGIQLTEAATLSLTDSAFTGNLATEGAHLWMASASEASLRRVWLEKGGAQIGGALVVDDSTLSASNLIFSQNEARSSGGAIALNNGTISLEFSVFNQNSSLEGAALVASGGTATLRGLILDQNTPGPSLQANGGTITLENSIFWNQTSDYSGFYPGIGVFWADPMFVKGSDFVLSSLSPALDTGPADQTDPDTTPSDIGAYGGPLAWSLPDSDEDGVVFGRDCNDEDAKISPYSQEIWYDGVDQNCDGWNDYDADRDGYTASVYGGEDCNDVNVNVNPEAQEHNGDQADQDCDGLSDIDADHDGYSAVIDCNDENRSIFPSAPEIWYNGQDEDCSGGSDYDADGDGYDIGEKDCDDRDPLINIDAVEIADDGIDQDCSGKDFSTGTPGQPGAVVVEEEELTDTSDKGTDSGSIIGCSTPAAVGLPAGLLPLLIASIAVLRGRKE